MTYQPQDINCETGVLYGCLVSTTSGSTTQFDVSSGAVCIVDWTNISGNLGKSRSQVLTYPGETGITPVSGVETLFTGLFLTESASAGVAVLEQILEADLIFNSGTRRGKVSLQSLSHQDVSGTISGITDDYQLAYEWEQQLNDWVNNVGVLSRGNRYSAGVSGNFVNKAVGDGGKLHFNAANDPKSPVMRNTSAVSGIDFIYTKQVSGGGGGAEFTGGVLTSIDPDQYDNNGTLTSIPVNDFTIQTIFFFPQSGQDNIAYGQSTYGSLALAEDAINDGTFDDEFVIPPLTINNGVRVTYLIVREGTTDLNIATDAKFKQFRNITVQETGT